MLSHTGCVISFSSMAASITTALRKPLPHATAEAGERGELAAMFYLQKLGFIIVARRWQANGLRGEIDLIAWEGDALCFVEVKTRGSRSLVDAARAVDERKQNALRKVARRYLYQLPSRVNEPSPADRLQVRFDTVTVYLDSLPDGIELVRNAFV